MFVKRICEVLETKIVMFTYYHPDELYTQGCHLNNYQETKNPRWTLGRQIAIQREAARRE